MRRRLSSFGLISISSILIVSCSASQTTGKPSVPPPKTNSEAAKKSTPATNVSISIGNFQFSPKSITVKKGTTVTWTNSDTAPHTITGDKGGPDSPKLATGKKYSYTFKTAGTFDYHCAVHPTMKATVTVKP